MESKNKIGARCEKYGFTLLEDDIEWFFDYLSDMRDSGINMFGASKYMRLDFDGMCINEANWIIGLWMQSFEEESA